MEVDKEEGVCCHDLAGSQTQAAKRLNQRRRDADDVADDAALPTKEVCRCKSGAGSQNDTGSLARRAHEQPIRDKMPPQPCLNGMGPPIALFALPFFPTATASQLPGMIL